MSYPFIGMDGEESACTPENVEAMLRDGKHIFLEDDISFAIVQYDAQSDSFLIRASERVKPARSFKTYAELTTYIAFNFRDFL